MTAPDALDVEAVIAQARYVRSLARALVFDPHLARDVEQETLLAALEHAPRERGALRAWLAVLVRNLAIKAWRSGVRREQRERKCARPESAVPSPAELLEREDLRRALVERLLALDEPLRDTLVLRYFVELPPREIARRLELPVETVRTRTQRGLALLRERLDRESRGDRSAWALALVHGLELRASPAQIGACLVSSISGVLVMSLAKKAALAAAVIVLVAGSFVLRSRLGRASGQVAENEALEPTAPALSPSTPKPSAGADGSARSEVLASEPAPLVQATATDGAVLLRVSWHDGTPAAGIGALLTPDGSGLLESQEGMTDSEGTCLFEHLASGNVSVFLDRQVRAEMDIRSGERVEHALTIPRGNDVDGIVLEADGRPVAGAEVCVDLWYDGLTFVLTHSDAEGRFSIPSVCSERSSQLYARAPLHAPAPQWVLDGGKGHTYEVRLIFPAQGGGLEGTVRDGEGQPVEQAWVQIGDEMEFLTNADIPLPDGSEGKRTILQLATTDSEGRFRIPSLAIGVQAVKVRAHGRGPWKGEIEIFDGRPAHLDVTLLEGTSVAGTVTDPAGRPMAGVQLRTARDNVWFLGRVARSKADGTYLLEDLPAGEFELRAMLSDIECDSTKVSGAPGLLVRWDPRIDSGLKIRGRVVVPGLDHARFFILASAMATDGRQSGGSLTTDENGRFELARCLNLPHQIEVGSLEQPMYPVAVVKNVLPGLDEIVIEVDPSRLQSVRLKGRVLDSRGEPQALITVSPERKGSGSTQFQPRSDGTFDLGPFPPDRWGLTVWKKGTPLILLRVDPVEVAPGQTQDFGDLIVE